MTTDEPDAPLRIRLVLVHHGDPGRLAAVRDTVATVATALGAFGDVEVRNIGRQPSLRSLPPAKVAARRVRQWRLERRWAHHLGAGRRWFLSAGLLLVRLAALSLPREQAKAGRRSFIELALSSKHQLAWRAAAEDRVDVLVVLEDDARVRPDSDERIRTVLETAIRDSDLARVYADLAGGISTSLLRTERVSRRISDGLVELSRPATNTTCAYLIGSTTIAALFDHVTLEPQSALLPADWLMNAAFIGNSDVRCLHTSPTALDHGSFTGAVGSSIRI
ncbi:hypothetical protein [Nocardioides iriomotensis]|uniref:Uncharacterized protein n=1 Tax=Nocardioides iriomotensis TaxID=715784 RepID=A0A4Q5J417_9ACTN|nr:hypothetical protein [Nocardioides iriomotensis]RYU13352.1 hypothetical protein ETU37_05800 [Nocardioides iriomotensis]